MQKESFVKPRIEYGKVSPGARNAMRALGAYVHDSGLEQSLIDLVQVRASILNECAYCIDMHTKNARVHGETELRLYGLAAWKETPYYTERERAALAWTDAVTLVSETNVPDDVFNQAREYFGEKELVDLTMAIITINGWNRLAISFRTVPGTYQPTVESTSQVAQTAAKP